MPKGLALDMSCYWRSCSHGSISKHWRTAFARNRMEWSGEANRKAERMLLQAKHLDQRIERKVMLVLKQAPCNKRETQSAPAATRRAANLLSRSTQHGGRSIFLRRNHTKVHEKTQKGCIATDSRIDESAVGGFRRLTYEKKYLDPWRHQSIRQSARLRRG
jgi:hypothetical protein